MTPLGREWGKAPARLGREMRAWLTWSLAAAACLGAPVCLADLVVFEDGRVVKAASYEVHQEAGELEIGVPGGGSYRVALDRVERIVEDEIVVADVTVELPPPPVLAQYDLSYKADRKPLFASPYDAVIDSEAKRHGVDASFVSAVIRAESNYSPRAVSRKGARGLMQLMPATAKRLSVRRPFDPAANVAGGVRYLKELLDRFGHRPELVLAAYNAGERAVESYGGVPPYRETLGYVQKILTWWTPAIATTVAPNPASSSGVAATSSPASR
jgi:hypothetical protein